MAAREHGVHGCGGRAIAVAEDMRPFKKGVARDHRVELLGRLEEIIAPFHLARPLGPGGGRNRHFDILVSGEHGARKRGLARPARSEEHTSELQSLMRNSYAVFCLKKKQHYYQ